MKVRALIPNLAKSDYPKERWWMKHDFLWNVHHYWQRISSTIRCYLFGRHNRIVMKELERHLWWDADTKILYACFQVLTDYVERELAWLQLIAENKVRWYHRWFRIRNSRQLAMKYLLWEITQVEGEQGEAARTIRDLYIWWRDERPNRKDPWDEFEDTTEAAREETKQEEEDTEKLTELIGIRNWLWT